MNCGNGAVAINGCPVAVVAVNCICDAFIGAAIDQSISQYHIEHSGKIVILVIQ